MRRSAISFIIVGVVCLALTAYIAGQITHFGLTPRYTLVASFADATNLHSGNPVRLAGVEVGLVSSVKLVNGQAEVHFRVNKNVTVPDDSEIAVRWVNLIGQRELYLYPGTSATKLQSGARMTRTRSVVDLGQLFNELGPLTQALDPKQVNNLLETLVTSFNGNIPNIDTITADLKSILGTLASRKETISQMISDYQTLTNAVSQRDLQIQTAVDNLDSLATAFAQSDSVLNDALVQLPKFSANVNTFLTGNATQLGQMIDGLQGITSVGHERVTDLASMLNGLPASMSTLIQFYSLGKWLNVNIVCISTNKPPCPHPIILASDVAGSGPLNSPANFMSTLVGSKS